jgi:hypothetical protein
MQVDEGIGRKELRRAASRREPRIARDHVIPPKSMTDLERQFLVVLFGDARVRSLVLPDIDVEDIEGLASEPVFRAVLHAHRSGEAIGYAEISETLPDSARQDLASLVSIELGDVAAGARGDTLEESLENAARNCLAQFRRARFHREHERLLKEIRQAESEGDDARLTELYARKIELGRLLAVLTAQPR